MNERDYIHFIVSRQKSSNKGYCPAPVDDVGVHFGLMVDGTYGDEPRTEVKHNEACIDFFALTLPTENRL